MEDTMVHIQTMQREKLTDTEYKQRQEEVKKYAEKIVLSVNEAHKGARNSKLVFK